MVFHPVKLLSLFFGTFSYQLQFERRKFRGDSNSVDLHTLDGSYIDDLRFKMDTLYCKGGRTRNCRQVTLTCTAALRERER